MSKPRPAAKPTKSSAENASPGDERAPLAKIFAAVVGAFLGLSLLKFPNPPIMEKLAVTPASGWEWLLTSWPIAIAYGLLALMGAFAFFAGTFKMTVPKWLLVLPLVWLGWQLLASTHTLNVEYSHATVKHFVACVACFYLGVFGLPRDRKVLWCWGMLSLALAVVIAVGLQQHFGGLADTRRYFFAYVYPTLSHVDADYLKKISSNRIFSTLFYPNALAGALLLLLPVSLALIWRDFTRFTQAARGLLAGLLGVGAAGCLLWSGSKGGWLLMLLLGVVALLYSTIPRKLKLAVIAGILVLGLMGFALKYAGYFQRKATSVSARFDYWEAAVRTTAANPLFGTGPGTFAIPYQKIKRPESEMARLTHNDYLQQASDSGVVGFLAFTAFIVGALVYGRPRNAGKGMDWVRLGIWLGVLGLALQFLLEFSLYLPALAWCGFLMLGWLVATSPKPVDNSKPVA